MYTCVFIIIIAFVIFFILIQCKKEAEYYLYKAQNEAAKYKQLYRLMCIWDSKKDGDLIVKEYLEKNNFQTIAIYGMGDVGLKVLKSLDNSGIKVAYGIDNGIVKEKSIKVISSRDEFEKVDAIIVTPIFDYYAIEQELKNKGIINIINIEDVIYCEF